MSSISILNAKLSKPTPLFSLKLWVVIIICISLFILLFFSLYFTLWCHRKRNKPPFGASKKSLIPKNLQCSYITSSLDRRLLSRNASEVEMGGGNANGNGMSQNLIVVSDQCSNITKSDVGDLGSIGKYRYMLREIEVATNGFADDNMIEGGDHGAVYRGVLLDATRVAVKQLLCNSLKAEHFAVEVDAIKSIRHRNLIKLLGYCNEGTYSMLVYEYVDNSNLHRWLHGWIGQANSIAWTTRTDIILGIAKGLAYLHEDIEPKVVHGRIKSRNILLDHQWSPKISDFGIARLLGSERGHATAPLVGMSGYIAPEYATTGVSNDKSDVYSFGVLIMEIVSGKTPIEYSGTELEVHLVDWFKAMVANQQIHFIPDPKLPEMPSLIDLKRIILIALRCVDPDVENRPRMGDVIHMLEPLDLLLSDEKCIMPETSSYNSTE